MNPEFRAMRFSFAHTLLFALLCLIGVRPLMAQYTPLLSQTQWLSNENTPLSSSFDWYELNVDTTINGVDYQLALRNGLRFPAWVREDLNTEQVFTVAAWNGFTERLLYDFTLSVNDTVALSFRYGGTMRFVVSQIDQVNTTMGFQDRWTLQNIDGNLPASIQWVEGVGSLAHPFYLDAPVSSDTSYRLSCNYMSGLKFYDDGFGTCPASPPALDREEEEKWRGPEIEWASDGFGIRVEPGKPWQVEVYDLFGRRHWARKLPAGWHWIPKSDLPHGTLLLRFQRDDQNMTLRAQF